MAPPYQRRFALKSPEDLPMYIGYLFGCVLVMAVYIWLISEFFLRYTVYMMNILPIYQANTQRRGPRRETERELLMRVAKEQQREERRERRSAIVRRVTGRRDGRKAR